MEEEGGGMEPSGFPIPGCPSAASPAAVIGGRGETRDQGLLRLWSAASGAAGWAPREGSGWGEGAGGDRKALWLFPLRAPLFCFVVLSSSTSREVGSEAAVSSLPEGGPGDRSQPSGVPRRGAAVLAQTPVRTVGPFCHTALL